MRFIGGRRIPEQDETLQATTADFVLQVGNMKVPLKAEKLLGSAIRVSGNTEREMPRARVAHERAANDEDKAIEAFSRMQEAFSGPTHQGQRGGSWAPWSPDDLYPYPGQTKPTSPAANSNAPDRLRREPSDANLPGYFDSAAQQPYNSSQQAPTPAPALVTRGSSMAVHQGAPTIFDNLGAPPTPSKQHSLQNMKHFEATRRSKTNGHSSKPRKLDLVQLFPQPRPSTGRLLSPSRLSSSPSALADRADFPLPPLPTEGTAMRSLRSKTTGKSSSGSLRPSTSNGSSGKKKVFDEDIFDQHKTNVRRPPKGIQNWFDAYLDSEDEDEDDEEDDDEDDEGDFQKIPRPATAPQLEPQELPADDVLPPAYSAPSREISRASEKSGSHTRSLDPIRDDRQAAERNAVQEEMARYRNTSECHSWDSIQSSHIGRLPPTQVTPSTAAGQSVLSLSESEYTDVDVNEEENGNLPAIRDSILVDRNVTIASASSIDLHKAKPHLEQGRSGSWQSGRSHESKSSMYSSDNTQVPTALPTPSTDLVHPTAEQVALRHMSSFAGQSPSGASEAALDEAGNYPPDAAHVMAVTEEEKMLLDLMRRKRTMMQQLSFTEGYQMALQTEQQRVAKRAASASHGALKALRRKEVERRDSQMGSVISPIAEDTDMRRHLSQMGSAISPISEDTDMRRQLSQMRQNSVDSRFHIERYLDMAEPHPLSSHPVDQSDRRLSGELLPATVYSPAGTPSSRSPALREEGFNENAETDSITKRVQHFIATNGAVPPLNTQIKTMRRRSFRRASSMPPSPVMEEEHPPPEIPERSRDRHHHTRDMSGYSLEDQLSSVSYNDEIQECSPGSQLPAYSFSADIPIHHHYQQQQQQRQSKPEDPSRKTISHSTSNPTLSSQTTSPVSPFSCLINAAASAKQSPTTSSGNGRLENTDGNVTNNQSAPNTEPKTTSPVPPTMKKLPIPLSRFNSAEAHSSMISISSAGEDVLAAWAELGGAPQGLSVKRKVKASGPLSAIMNA